MAIINDVDMPNFTHKEIPPIVAKYMDKLILSRIQIFRNLIECPFNISMSAGALIRFDGSKTSEHYVVIKSGPYKTEKSSKAIDGFPSCNIFKAWTTALSSGLFSGIGVYFDTSNNYGMSQPMLHLDLRPKSLIWYRDKDEYFYPHKDKDFFRKLNLLLGGWHND